MSATTVTPPVIPSTRLDFYGAEAILDPAPTYRALRDLGPVVRLRKPRVLAVGRFDDVRSVLRRDDVFVSSEGVSVVGLLNRASRDLDAVLLTDGDRHAELRRILIEPMRPRALEEIRSSLQARAEERVDHLARRGGFDAMSELAADLPLSVVAERVGLRSADRDRMLAWSKATFTLIGAFNRRALRAIPTAIDMLRFQRTVDRRDVVPGSWVHRLFELRDAGRIGAAEAQGMVLDYVAPSLDTTIFAIGNLLHRLARHPDQYARLRADPALIPAAVNEGLRIDSVIRAFSRVAAAPTEIGGVPIQAGTRVLVVYGAANRDERHFSAPDEFDVTRDARDHLAFGHGVHACAGAALARMEMEVLLQAIVERVARIEAGPPRSALNNTLFGFKSLPLRFFPNEGSD